MNSFTFSVNVAFLSALNTARSCIMMLKDGSQPPTALKTDTPEALSWKGSQKGSVL